MTRLEVRANLLWGALAAFIALFFLLLAPKVGFGIGLLLALVGLVAWSLRRPELLVIGTLIAALLGNLGRLHSAGAGSLTLYQLVFAAAILCYGWLVLTRREPVPRVSPALWLLLLFLVGEFAALPVAKDLSGGVVAFVSLSLGVLFAFLVIGVCTTSSRLRSVLVAFVFLAAAFGFWRCWSGLKSSRSSRTTRPSSTASERAEPSTTPISSAVCSPLEPSSGSPWRPHAVGRSARCSSGAPRVWRASASS